MKSKYIREKPAKELMELHMDIRKRMLVALMITALMMAGLYVKPCMYAAAALLAVWLFYLPSEQAVEILLYFMVFANVFKTSQRSSSLFTYLQIIPIAKMVFLEKDFRLNRSCLGALICYAVYTIAFCFNGVVSYLRLVTGLMLLAGIFQSGVVKRLDCRRMLIFYSMGIVVSGLCAVAFASAVKPYVSYLVVRLEDGSAVDRFSGLFQNSNYYSMEISLALAGHTVLFRNGEEKRREYIFIALALLALGIMTQSKTFVITAAIIVAAMIPIIALNHPGRLLAIIALGAAAALAFRNQLTDLVEKYFHRILTLQEEGASLTEMTTGRSDIWLVYLKVIVSDIRTMFLGNGIETRLFNFAPHNLFVEAWFCLGIIGMALYAAVIVLLRQPVARKRRYLIFAVVLLVRANTANIAFYTNFYYYLILLFALRDKGTCERAREVSFMTEREVRSLIRA